MVENHRFILKNKQDTVKMQLAIAGNDEVVLQPFVQDKLRNIKYTQKFARASMSKRETMFKGPRAILSFGIESKRKTKCLLSKWSKFIQTKRPQL